MERLKQKVASSRVFASLQQVASTGASQQQQSASSSSAGSTTSQAAAVAQQDHQVVAGQTAELVDQQQQQQPHHHHQMLASPPKRSIVPEAAMSTAWLMAADATAHLTDEEKGILLEVFKKEEQFQRDTIKQLTASRAQQQQLQAAASKQLANMNKENHHRPFTATALSSTGTTTPTLTAAAAATKRQYNNKNNQSTNSMCSSSGTALNSVSSATPTSSNQSSRPCSCTTLMCGHATPSTAATLTNTSSSSIAPAATNSQTTPMTTTSTMMMMMGAIRTPSRNSTLSLASSSTTTTTTTTAAAANNQIDNKSANNDQSSASTATTTTAMTTGGGGGAPANIGQCRICRKTIEPSEPCHLCSNCNQFICDDCASYSASDQFWMCSSCRRRTLNPAIPAEALKELGLNQNSSAVRRMTLRLNQTELKMAVNKCSSESKTSNQTVAAAGPQQRSQPLPAHQQQQLQLRRQSSARRTTSDGDSTVPVSEAARRAPPPLNRQNSLGPQQHIPTGRRSSSQAQLLVQQQQQQQQQSTFKQQQQEGPRSMAKQASHQQMGASSSTPIHTTRQVQQSHQQAQQPQQQQQPTQPAAISSGQSRTEPTSSDQTSSGSSGPLVRSSSRQRCKSGGKPLKRVNSVQQQRLAAQKTLSQPTSTTSTLSQQQQAQQQQQQQQQQRSTSSKWQECPESQRVPAPLLTHSQRRDSLNLQLDQRIEQSLSSMVAPQSQPQQQQQQQQQPQQQQEILSSNQWQPQMATVAAGQHATTTGATGAYMDTAYAANPIEPQFEQSQAQLPMNMASSEPDHQQQQLMRNIMANHRNSLAFSGINPIQHHHHQQHQQQQQQQMFAGSVSSTQPSSVDSSRHGSYSQQPGSYMSQLIPVPPEQMHLRRLSDQSNLVRRSSIIASNLFDGTTIARNRSHSNIDTVHYLHQQVGSSSRHQLNDEQPFSLASSAWHQSSSRRQSSQVNERRQLEGQQLKVGGGGPSAEMNSSSASNLYYLQPNQQQQHQEHHQQRRLSDGGQYFTTPDQQQQQQQQQQISSIVTSYAQKQQSRRRRRQSSEEMHSDSSSDIDQMPGMRTDNQAEDAYAFQQQQPITIPSVSVSEFAAAAARRRSSIHMQQQQQQQLCDDQLMASYQQDNQITPMQINVAIEQVIQQQQQEQLAPEGQQQLRLYDRQDPTQLLYMMRRGSSGRVLPCIPGGQSRSLLELPLNGAGGGGGQMGGGQQQGCQPLDANSSGGPNKLSNGNTRNNSTAALNQVSTLDLPCLSPTIRRASAPEGQIIKIVVDDIDSSLPFGGRHPQNGMKHHQFDQHLQAGNFYERHILYRDDSLDPNGNHVGRGFGLQVMGGKLDQDGKLQACVKWVLQGGPADKVGIRPGDKLIEWDGKCLVDMSYEQVAEVIESSANIAEVIVKPKPQRLYDPHQPPANYVLSQRRLSHQTERDLRRHHQQAPVVPGTSLSQQQQQQQRRMSCAIQPSSSGSSTVVGNETMISRMGTGRRLPQIPAALQPGGGGQNFDAKPGQLGIGGPVPVPVRHASTGQLDQAMTGQMLGGLMGSQANSTGGSGSSFMVGQSSHHLGPTTYHLGAEQQQQQSRSAGELHRGSATGLSYAAQTQLTHNDAASLNNSMLAAPLSGGWIQPQQYGGSQQMIPSSGGSYGIGSTGGGGQNQTYGMGRDELSGLIGLQVNVDERLATLEISVLSAHNIDRDPSLDYVVKVRILPENSTRFKVCTTQPSSDMNWKETFLFQNFPIHQIQRMALEIGIWVYDEAPRLSAQMEQPICEALIPIQSARERNIDFWPLRPPPTSPNTRRKSLNDIIGNQYGQKSSDQSARILAAYKSGPPSNKPGQEGFMSTGNDKRGSFGSLVRVSSGGGMNDSSNVTPQRERSSSIRNLPDTGKSQMQPRRASDEVATSSSHRLMTRLSPAVSRRSISVMNVGDGYNVGRANRSPVSRLGSQANILKAIQKRRDSSQIQQQRDQSNNGSPIMYVSGV